MSSSSSPSRDPRSGSARGIALLEKHAAIARLQAEFLADLAEFDAGGEFVVDNQVTAQAWLRHHARMDALDARRAVMAARALRDLPQTAHALVAGEISVRHVDEMAAGHKRLGAAVMLEAEEMLVPLAKAAAPADVRAGVARVEEAVGADESREEKAQRIHDSRYLLLSTGMDGTVLITGRLDRADGMLVQKAIRAGSQPNPEPGQTVDPRTAAQRQADALVEIVQTHLGSQPGVTSLRLDTTLVVDLPTLRDELKPGDGHTGISGILGTAFTAEELRYLTCTADVSVLLTATLSPHAGLPAQDTQIRVAPGVPLALGRETRLATRAQQRALWVRDGGCIAPGCRNRRVQAHHVIHWSDGGPTDLSNMCLLCSRHHHLLHQGGWQLEPDPDRPGRFSWRPPDGGPPVPATHASDRNPGTTTGLW
ncbi:HNH endonuclease [Motilibacter rhizosphaerae]|uniref:HNH endonuclease n=1 Tax=Motilibacter rhizosphaerae TaxID=598652 RepID=A0A4Q7NWN4_9ACTN|nr:HNH endonuclease signature motif containing protein [Motilibacter rhizosphaerae]RZS91328.1 HNH endonuclease [Motilibacter rhizosphaerae]